MRVLRSTGFAGFLGISLGISLSGFGFSTQSTAHSADQAAVSTPAILPEAFGGWQMQGATSTSTDPATADPTNGEVLKEYRFTDFASSTYTRDDGRTLKLRAARFADSSGAFGAYTFYLEPEMIKEDVGDQGASLGQRVLFYRGHVLVDASFSQQSAMSVAQLRELAGALPQPRGAAANLPGFIQFLPRRDYIRNTQKYVMGPSALNAVAAPVGDDVVDFGASSEATLAKYDTPSGEATLMLISYPTPQMASDHLRRIDAAHPQGDQKPGVSAIGNAGTFFYKRTGPIIAITSGPVSESDAKSLLGRVNYEATITWNTPAEETQVRDLYKLILNIVVLCGILGALAIVAGVAFGGFRVLMKRMYPDRVFDRPEQVEFISLRLNEVVIEELPRSGSEGSSETP
jgi:hypothetical protein